ncbi:MAG: RloB domain-containing protein [Sphaerochaetaceae bacterium]|nr:RloB domain-containing protein [Sphaerochaetaceae bacterium]
MRRKKKNEAPRKTLLIVTSTESESLYFSQMRKDCRYTNMSVLWAQEAQTLEDIIKFASRERIKGHFDSVWCTLSFQKTGITPQNVREYQQFALKKKVNLAWNNPDISLWYLLHLQSPRLPISDTKVIESSLKGVFPQFTSEPSYLLKEGMNLHLKLFNAKAQAVVNGSAYNKLVEGRMDNLEPVHMTRLLNDITTFCGNADMSHNQKLIGLKNN